MLEFPQTNDARQLRLLGPQSLSSKAQWAVHSSCIASGSLKQDAEPLQLLGGPAGQLVQQLLQLSTQSQSEASAEWATEK